MEIKIDKKYMNEVKEQSIPERVLLFNILVRAIYDLKERDSHTRQHAINWFYYDGKEKSKKGFTFLQICEFLDLDSDQIFNMLKYKGAFGNNYIQPVKKTKRIYYSKYKTHERI